MIDKEVERLLCTKDEQLNKLNQIAMDAVNEQDLLSHELYLKEEIPQKISFGDRLSDKVAEFGGSWRFIIIFMVILIVWIGLNTWILIERPFDPYPFILLNLLLSCVAALQAPIIMMSQNRKEDKDRKRAENDYLINLKSEIEIRMLNQKLDLLMSGQMVNMLDLQRKELEKLEQLIDKTNKPNTK